MTTVNYIIVEADEAYNNEKEFESGVKLVVNTTIESVQHINRVATVISAPENTILKEGDEVVIHHNIMRFRNGIKGELVKSNYHIEDGKYFVPPTEIFMYKRKGEKEWRAIEPFCFVKPIPQQKERNVGGIVLSNRDGDNHKGNIRHVGIMMYPNEKIVEMGVERGDKIAFSKNSEYEFEIEGEILYKMSTKDILAKIE